MYRPLGRGISWKKQRRKIPEDQVSVAAGLRLEEGDRLAAVEVASSFPWRICGRHVKRSKVSPSNDYEKRSSEEYVSFTILDDV